MCQVDRSTWIPLSLIAKVLLLTRIALLSKILDCFKIVVMPRTQGPVSHNAPEHVTDTTKIVKTFKQTLANVFFSSELEDVNLIQATERINLLPD